MALRTRTLGKHKIVTFSNGLDFYNYAENKQALQSVLSESDTNSFVMDLGNLQHLDSSGIALIAHVLKTVKDRRGELALLSVNAAVRNIMRLTHLEEYFSFIDSEADLSA
jgi:anti-sigma B factor antagonist